MHLPLYTGVRDDEIPGYIGVIEQARHYTEGEREYGPESMRWMVRGLLMVIEWIEPKCEQCGDYIPAFDEYAVVDGRRLHKSCVDAAAGPRKAIWGESDHEGVER